VLYSGQLIEELQESPCARGAEGATSPESLRPKNCNSEATLESSGHVPAHRREKLAVEPVKISG